jgi:hypothetical protein
LFGTVDSGDLKAPPKKGAASSRVEKNMCHGVALGKLAAKIKCGLPEAGQRAVL